jgi:hypothetical protein
LRGSCPPNEPRATWTVSGRPSARALAARSVTPSSPT